MKALFATTIIPISAIFLFRMLGLFMLIPVFSTHAMLLQGATPALVGIALGSYGLTQGLMQIPFGLLSDRYGRKPLLTLGLIVFGLGTLLGALTHSIGGMICARSLQGVGAIGSVLIALMADLTPEHQRTLAMGCIGASISLAFGLSFLMSPVLVNYAGLGGIFEMTFVLILLALFLLHGVIPTPIRASNQQAPRPYLQQLGVVVKNRNLWRLNASIFFQHHLFVATFFAIPLSLQTAIANHHLQATWQFYVPMLCIAFALMVPLIVLGERKQHMNHVFISMLTATVLAQVALVFYHRHWAAFMVLVYLYFTAFTTLEAILPSAVSKQTNPDTRGTAMGVYSSSQFLGIFSGGCTAGMLYQGGGHSMIYTVNAGIACLWLLLSLSLQLNKPKQLS